MKRGSGCVTAWPPENEAPSGIRLENLDRWMAEAPKADIVIPKATFPVGEVASNATLLADVIDEPDMDGIFRRARLFQIFDGRVVPSLGFAAFANTCLTNLNRDHDPSRRTTVAGKLGKNSLLAGVRSIPFDSGARMIPRFRGPSGTFESYSAAPVIQSELLIQSGRKPPIEKTDVFKDCYVFFGSSAPSLLDLRPTPISKVFPGVEIHATVLDNLLSGDFLRDPPTQWVVAAR